MATFRGPEVPSSRSFYFSLKTGTDPVPETYSFIYCLLFFQLKLLLLIVKHQTVDRGQKSVLNSA